VSADADRSSHADALPGWERLERAAEAAVSALDTWRGRALEAEAEVVRLRTALEEAVADFPASGSDARDQLRRLRAENAALRSRMSQVHRRISAMLEWTDALGGQR
jgi:phage shock protein A